MPGSHGGSVAITWTWLRFFVGEATVRRHAASVDRTLERATVAWHLYGYGLKQFLSPARGALLGAFAGSILPRPFGPYETVKRRR